MTRSRCCFGLLGCVLAGACSSKAANKPTLPPQVATASGESAAPPAAVVASPHVGVSPDLAKQCRLQFSSRPQAPKFDFDQFELLVEDRNVLDLVAQCVTRGPLRGRAVQLVGRADARGTEEYNLGLGTRRAESVRGYLQRLGVPAQQLRPSTRGDIDANGVDEAGWRVDRRVDLELK